VLLAAGADPNARNDDAATPLSLAEASGDLVVSDALRVVTDG
jgi:ankyrin repeat protein